MMLTEQLTEAIVKRLFIEVEASARHVHLTKKDAMQLFGHSLTKARPLSQPGQYLCRERVWLRGPKGEIKRVAVLGPERDRTQVELSMTDCFALGVSAPVRQSGDIEGTPGVTIGSERGEITTTEGVIVAQRHIHMTPGEAEIRGLKDGQKVRLRCLCARPITFEEVIVRVRADFAPYAHIDLDEANACGLKAGDLGLILPS